MKIILLSDPDFPDSDLEKEVIKCGVRIIQEKRLTVILVEDEGQERCVERLLTGAVEYYVIEGVPRSVKYVSPAGRQYILKFL